MVGGARPSLPNLSSLLLSIRSSQFPGCYPARIQLFHLLPLPQARREASGRQGGGKPPRKSLISVLKNAPLSTELPLDKTNSDLSTGLPDGKWGIKCLLRGPDPSCFQFFVVFGSEDFPQTLDDTQLDGSFSLT